MMYDAYIYYACACSIDGWRCKESASHSHTCRTLAHRQRPHAIACACKNTLTRTHLHTRTLRRYIYIHIVHDVCVGSISRRTYPRAHAMATAASSARAIAPTVHIYLYMFKMYIYIHIYAYIYTHTYNPSLLRAAIPTHADTRACACPHVCAHTRATARAASNTPPSASRPWWRAARAEKAAHTLDNVVTAAVFHAPMFALNADA